MGIGSNRHESTTPITMPSVSACRSRGSCSGGRVGLRMFNMAPTEAAWHSTSEDVSKSNNSAVAPAPSSCCLAASSRAVFCTIPAAARHSSGEGSLSRATTGSRQPASRRSPRETASAERLCTQPRERARTSGLGDDSWSAMICTAWKSCRTCCRPTGTKQMPCRAPNTLCKRSMSLVRSSCSSADSPLQSTKVRTLTSPS
mmetsp:Transcript_3244/g.5719  ORF Transcript_3244/g.5719 Transcript_3244/m.5719 type:complete len:201 (+) Transcript_3244:140-742(+)